LQGKYANFSWGYVTNVCKRVSKRDIYFISQGNIKTNGNIFNAK